MKNVLANKIYEIKYSKIFIYKTLCFLCIIIIVYIYYITMVILFYS